MADNENPNVENIEPVEMAAEEQEPDEEFETIPVGDLLDVKLGRQGENDTQTVVIDCSAWLTQLPGCQLMIAATRPGEREIYLPEVSVSNGVVTWPILEQDTACAGTGRAEVRAMKDGKIKKSAMFRTRIEPALEGDGSPDAPTPPNWVRLIIDSVEEAQASVERSEELVDEATACAINAVRFDTAQNLTGTQKVQARENIEAPKSSAIAPDHRYYPATLSAGSYALHEGELYRALVDILAGETWTPAHWEQTDVGYRLKQHDDKTAQIEEALSGKVAINQSTTNAGKALVVGVNGSVTMGDAVRFDEVQTLTEVQKEQAQVNVGLETAIATREELTSAKYSALSMVIKPGAYNCDVKTYADSPCQGANGVLFVIRRSTNWNVQVFMPTIWNAQYDGDRNVYYRIVNRNNYSTLLDWTPFTDLSAINEVLDTAIASRGQIWATEYASLAEVVKPGVYFNDADTAEFDDIPVPGTNGLVIVAQRSANWNIQIYFPTIWWGDSAEKNRLLSCN